MFDPASITLGQASSAIRDLTVVVFLITTVWKSRGVYESAKKFFDRLTIHMDVMETGMSTLLGNHLKHIEQDLRVLSGRQPDLVETQDETEK
ncbi:Uncharacterised protein [uncultured archaeon]|nr:Uncharacterised protein [uncultured archaeon]